ncbi:MAG: hypothetical protein KDC37_03070, partial [Flavobacteriales bacterium]|nr:hypothetical protein [Flavobacteriales bacterium]
NHYKEKFCLSPLNYHGEKNDHVPENYGKCSDDFYKSQLHHVTQLPAVGYLSRPSDGDFSGKAYSDESDNNVQDGNYCKIR